MSHRRNTSRRRRGSAGERRGWRAKPAAWALAAAAAIAAGTQAYAAPIRWDNPPGPNHFVWFGGTDTEPIGLEIVSSAGSQTGACDGLARFAQSNELPNGDRVFAPTGGGLEVGGYADVFLVGLYLHEDEGVGIPSGAEWRHTGYIYHPHFGSWLPEGVEAILGVRFPLVGGAPLNYGWIGVEKFIADDGSHQLDAFAWGYEAEPGVPLVFMPEPGALFTLALGAAGVAVRRRR